MQPLGYVFRPNYKPNVASYLSVESLQQYECCGYGQHGAGMAFIFSSQIQYLAVDVLVKVDYTFLE